MNRKGFTLVELLATILILALLVGIGTYSITTVISNAKNKNYVLLITNIKDASEVYYQECKYSFEKNVPNNSGIECREDGNIELGKLVEYGYLKGNSKVKSDDTNTNNKYTLVNPKDNEPIGECVINISFSGGQIVITDETKAGSCPKTYDATDEDDE